MIRFFRHIRKTLMEQNKVRKYLLYALGEILLVVIGILIALQVNNWNEERKLNNQRKAYTNSIINDFEKDSIVLQTIIDQTRNDSMVFSSFENRLKSQPVNYDTIQRMFRYEFPFYVRPDYSFNNNTLLSIIENQSDIYPVGLVDSLVVLIKFQKDFEKTNDIMINKYFDMLNDKNKYPFDGYFFDGGKAIKDSIWSQVDQREMLADFQRLADWKKAYTILILQNLQGLQKLTVILKRRLYLLEKT